MFNIGDAVTIKSSGRYNGCNCDYCRVFLAGGYGIIKEIDECDNQDHTCKMHLFNIDGTIAYSNSYYYRFSGMRLFHSNETPDWEI